MDEAWGETRYAWGDTPTTRRFTGQIEDDTIGLYFYNARYYDAALGRFVQADTVVPEPANPQSFNRYSYTYNNPLAYVDPSGHWPSWLERAAGAAHQFIDDMTGGTPTRIMGDGWKYNSSEAYQEGRRAGRAASTATAAFLVVDGGKNTAAGLSSLGPTATGTAVCAAATEGVCAVPGGLVMLGEGALALGGMLEAGWGAGVLAKVSGDPLEGDTSSIRWKGFSKGKLKEHFDKHGKEFGDISQNTYLRMAKDFAAETGAGIREEIVSNFLIKYDPATGRVFVGHMGGREIRTFYIAEGGSPFQEALNLARELIGQ